MGRVAPALLMAVCTGCSVVNDIDVCGRRIADEWTVNIHEAGNQRFESPSGLSPMPGGGAFVAFISDAETTLGDMLPVVRGRIVGESADDNPFTCMTTDEEVYTGVLDGSRWVAVGAPSSRAPSSVGILVYDRATMSSLKARLFFATGCRPDGELGNELEVGDEVAPEEVLAAPVVTRLYDGQFLILWAAGVMTPGDLPRMTLKARRTSPLSGALLHSTEVTALTTGQLYGYSAAAIGPDRTAVAWLAFRPDGVSTMLTIVDDRLSPVLGPVEIARRTTFFPEGVAGGSTTVAFDGGQLLVAWAQVDEGGLSRIFARFFDGEGRPLSSPDSPEGEPFRLTSSTLGQERRVTAIAAASGGFLVAWEEEEVPGREDDSGPGLRALAFDGTGARRFVNPSCDAADFPLNTVTEGTQTWPQLVRLEDGTIMAAWTDLSMEGDRSGSAVRVRAFRNRDLFPVE